MVEKLTIEELTLIKLALEESLEGWIKVERGLEKAKIWLPDHYHLLHNNDELPSQALDLAEMLLIKVNDELRLREGAGETVWWGEEETLIPSTDWRLVRRRN